MSTITVDVSEVLAKIDPADMERAIHVALTGAAQTIVADVKRYPPMPADSTYIRTMTLHNAWTTKTERQRAIIGNITPYAPYVQDAEQQAWMHRGRWQTTRDVALRKANEVKRLIEAALARWAR